MQVRFLFWAQILIVSLIAIETKGQDLSYPEEYRDKNIKTIQIILDNVESQIPALTLNSNSKFTCTFDDLNAYQDYLYYTIELRNYDWSPLNESYDYWFEGRLFNNIENFEFSTFSQTPYVHYTFSFPNSTCRPIKAGNYLLKVFRGTDTSKLIFAKKFYIVEPLVRINTSFSPPYNGQLLTSHQKLNLEINAVNINNLVPENLKVNLWQNTIPVSAVYDLPYQYYFNGIFKYDADRYLVFPGNRDFNTVDLRNYKFKSYNIDKITTRDGKPCLILKPDQVILNYVANSFDLNGQYYISSTEFINAQTQGDYIWVKFIFAPRNIDLFKKREIFVDGSFVYNGCCQTAKMDFDDITNEFYYYALLKLGFYSYNFYYKNKEENGYHFAVDFSDTENDYYTFVYYKNFTERHYSLVGFTKTNTLVN